MALGDSAVVTNLPAVVVGRIRSSAAAGPIVEWSGCPAPAPASVLWLARTPDWSRCIGLRVALLFEDGETSRPIVVGLLDAPPSDAGHEESKPEVLHIESNRELRIECGKASILLRADGKLELRGEYLLSRATGPNKIKGGSVQIN